MNEKQEVEEIVNKIANILEIHNRMYLEIVKNMQKMGDYADPAEIKNILNSEFEKIELLLDKSMDALALAAKTLYMKSTREVL